MGKIFEYIKQEVSTLIAKKIIIISTSLLIAISGIVWKYIDKRLNLMQSTINSAVVIPTTQTSINHYSVVKNIENTLLHCQQQGVFIGWLLIKTVYDTHTGKCDNNQTCPIAYYSIYFDTLRGIWGNINKVQDTKASNPYYERIDLVLDEKTHNHFLNSSLYKNGIVEIDEKIANQYNLEFLKEVYANLDLRKQGLTLEKIYLKPVLYKKDLIMVFSLSFQQIPKQNGNCYDNNLQAQGLVLNNIADHALIQYGIYNM
jgi:hypothetical protein